MFCVSFTVDYDAIDKSNIINIHKYVMLKKQYKIMFRLIKQVLFALLPFSESLATKCVSLNNEPCITRSTLIDLNPAELNY